MRAGVEARDLVSHGINAPVASSLRDGENREIREVYPLFTILSTEGWLN